MTKAARLAVVALAFAPWLLGAQTKTAALAGTVRDTIGNPLRMVAVMVEATELSAVTDDSGRFHIKGISAGRNDFTVRRIGFAAVEFGTTLAADSTLVIDIRMKPLTTLGAVNVVGERSKRLEQTGYFTRQNMGLGTFASPERVDSLSQIVSSPAQLLRGLRGVDLSCGPTSCVLKARIGPPCLNLFVNGSYRVGQLDENVQISEVFAIEFYPRPVLVPSEFQGKLPMKQGRGLTTSAGCGAVAVWTRIRAAP